jgi:hypothetical protein
MIDTHTRSTPAQSHLVAVVDLCPASTSGHQRGLYYLNRLIDESHTMTIDSSLECELSLKIWASLSEWQRGCRDRTGWARSLRRRCRAEAGKTLCPAEMVTHVADVTDAACVEPVLRWRIQLFLSCARYFNPHEHGVDQG